MYYNIRSGKSLMLGESVRTLKEAKFWLRHYQKQLPIINKGRVENGHHPIVDDYKIERTTKQYTLRFIPQAK